MKKGELVLYKCDCCNNEYPHRIEYWRKLSHLVNGNCWHTTCRKCENSRVIKENVKEANGVKLYKCFKCGQWLTSDNFQLKDRSSNGYEYRDYLDKRCKKCKQKEMKKVRASYNIDNARHYLFMHRIHGCKSRAKAKNLDFDLTLEYLEELWNKQNGFCAISGIPMTLNVDKGRNPYNVSVDQINPSGGYTKDNIQLVCMCVNQLKSDFDMSVILNICKNILNHNS